MSWRQLLQSGTVQLPWTGGRSIIARDRTYRLSNVPREHGWYAFTERGRNLDGGQPIDAQPDQLRYTLKGYLIGNRLIADGAQVTPNPQEFPRWSEPVFLIEPGLDRFVRIVAGRLREDGPLVYQQPDAPLGPEGTLQERFLERNDDIRDVRAVHPALEATFRLEVWRRGETDRRRAVLLAQQVEEERQRLEAARRQALQRTTESAVGRRQLVFIDFEAAARAALRIAGAEYLEHRDLDRDQRVVRFRLQGRRFECVCDRNLRIVDAGICLAGTDREAVLETLPAIIAEGIATNRLVIYRHV